MQRFIRHSLLILSLAASVPLTIPGESRAGGHNCCCQTCRQPCGQCNCGVPQASWQERDVVSTEYRTEQTLETVPVTVTENVTVDEGSYQTVWVPRLTTRPVARTVYQSRTACRTVPYQVTRRVSECISSNGTVLSARALPSYGSGIGYAATPSYASTISSPGYSGSNIAAGIYPTPIASRITPTPIGSRVPDARFADAPVTPIAPRTAAITPRSGGSFSDNRTADRSSLFVPAPSAAQVWRSTAIR